MAGGGEVFGEPLHHRRFSGPAGGDITHADGGAAKIPAGKQFYIVENIAQRHRGCVKRLSQPGGAKQKRGGEGLIRSIQDSVQGLIGIGRHAHC